MQAAPWAPSSTVKVIRGAPPLHIEPYGWTVDRWVFNRRIVDPSPQRGLGSFLYSRSAEFSSAHFHYFLLYKLLISGWAWPFHSTAAISSSMWFPPRTWLALAKALCAGPLGSEGNRYGIDSPSLALILPGSVMLSHFLCHVCVYWDCGPLLVSLHQYPVLRRDHQRYSQWPVKGIFIWKTNDQTITGNESLSQQPLCPVLNYLVNLTCNLICAQSTNAL